MPSTNAAAGDAGAGPKRESQVPLSKRLDERPCCEIVSEVLEKVLAKKGRELHLKELIASIGGLSEDDRDEPVTADSFTEYACFKHYLHNTVYFEDQFDFLIKCIAEGTCIVSDKPRLIDLLGVLTDPPPSHDFRFPETVVDYDRLLREDEERRIESFTLRRDWVPQIPPLEHTRDHPHCVCPASNREG